MSPLGKDLDVDPLWRTKPEIQFKMSKTQVYIHYLRLCADVQAWGIFNRTRS